MKSCAVCRAAAEDDERVCPNCGAPFPASPEGAKVVRLRELREQREAKRYWQSQRRSAQANRRRTATAELWGSAPATIVLVALTVLTSLFGGFVLGLGWPLPLRALILLFYNPGLLSLVFGAIFLWFIGSQLERELPLPLYLVVFFAAGIGGGLVEGAFGLGGVGLFPALWGMAGAFWQWGRSHRMGPYALQWIYGAIISTIAVNLLFAGFNIGPLILQIAVALAVGAAVVWIYEQLPRGGRRRR